MKFSRARMLGAVTASLYSLYYVLTLQAWHLIDNVDLIFHEAGHTIFFFLGEFVQILMGSGFQIFLPLSIAVYFSYRSEQFSASICLMWVGINILNVSVYARDAISMQLPLLGGDGVIHDWNYLLSSLNILSSTPTVATSLYMLGILTIGLGSILSFLYVPKISAYAT